MYDMEKVIKDLKDLENIMVARQEICPQEELQYWIELQESLADAIELLKEQEAVEPIRKKLKFSETWECGNCHEELFEGEVIRDNYCPNCGRSVKWE